MLNWRIGVSKPRGYDDPSLNQGSAEVPTVSSQQRVWDTPSPQLNNDKIFSLRPIEQEAKMASNRSPERP